MNTSKILKQSAPHLIAIATFVIISAIYFMPQFSGESLLQNDLMQYKGMIQEWKTIEKETGVIPLWTNSMFGGMPTYQVGAPTKGNTLKYVAQAMQLWIERPAGYFLLAMICSYVLLITIGVRPYIAIIGSIGYSITTYHLNIYHAGHTSKMLTLVFSPLVIAGVIQTLREKWISGFALFTLGLGLSILAGHYQMTYYLFLALLVMGIVELVRAIKERELMHIAKALAVFVVGGLLAVGASASKLLTTYEYSKDTMRGEPILASQSSTPASSSNVKGLEWSYAMNWSNDVLDLFATVIPGVAGGSSRQKVGPGTETYEAFKRGGVPMQRGDDKYQAPLYWGGQPFTDGPAYVGILFIFLFILGLFVVKDPLKLWISIAVLIVYLLSLGSNLEFFSRLFYDYVPLYNKFRAPSSILGISGLLIPVFAIYTLSEVLRKKPTWQDVKRPFYISLGITGGICLFFAILGPSVFGFSSPSDAQYAQNPGLVDLFVADRKGLMRSDAWRSLFIVLLGAGALWAFLNKKLKYGFAIAIIGLVSLFDLWSIGNRYLNWSDFEEGLWVEAYYQMRPADQQILNRESDRGEYRVLDLSTSTFNSTRTSYYHNSIGGYHAAKMQRYQDIIDRHISRNNPAVMNMLNTKYIITREGNVNTNSQALGNTWFVGGVNFVETADEEIGALNDFNPANSVVVHIEFKDLIAKANMPQGGSIGMVDYRPDHIVYESSTTADQIAVFSEIWYGPDKGWQAYIDGEPVEHFRANYILRGLVIPAGDHRVEFIFDPLLYRMGTTISWISSLIIILVALLAIYFAYRNHQENMNEEIVAKPAHVKPKKNKKKT